jgi:glycosyltransferase involved in cell wall biosynthesis
MKLSVIIPCFNESATIVEILNRVRNCQISLELEVIVIDDFSTDGTREILQNELGKLVDVLHLQKKNTGKGAAIREGFKLATGEIVLIQDADLEYDPSEYLRLLTPLLENKADVVFGSRFKGSDAHRVLYYWHSVGNKFLTQISNMFTNLNLTDMETCYKCFRREVIEGIELQENRFGIEPELTGKIASGKWRLYEVGISYSGRTYEEGKKIGWKDGMRAIYCIIKYSPMFEIRRMKKSAKS